MTKHLEMANTMVSLIMAVLAILLYFTGIISGLLAGALIIGATLMVAILAFRAFLFFVTRD